MEEMDKASLKRCDKCNNLMTRFDHHPERCRQCLTVEHLQEFTRQQQEKAVEEQNETKI